MNRLLILITVLCWSVWGLFNKIAVQKLHPIYMQIVTCVVAMLTIPMCFFLIKVNKPIEFNLSGALWTAAGSVLATIAYFAYVYGLRTGEVGTISVLSACYPALTFVLAAFFLGESVTLAKVIGIVLILIGIVILGY